ncbi:MAG: hypothetical protein OEV06_01975 [Anaerolineae bacterium]|nr:hypothetical protein [Anaerolineae bacterium]
MRIHQSERQIIDDQFSIKTVIEFDSPQARLPEELFYKFPARYADFSSNRADPFLVAILHLAMHLGENIQVHGAVSPQLAFHLEEYQRIFSIWYPHLFHPISIEYRDLAPPDNRPRPGVGLSFSGGVDSFFSLQRHLPANQPISHLALTHGFFIYGFDMPLADTADFDRLSLDYIDLFHSLGLELIPIHTNIRSFSAPYLSFTITHGAALASAGLLLDNFFHRQYIAPSYRYAGLPPWGSSPLTDHLLSTESLQIVHDSAVGSRLDRITEISTWQPVREHLRICSNVPHASYRKNCSRCDKCLRTMIILHILGCLDEYPTFSKKVTFLSIIRWGLLYNFDNGFHKLFLQEAREHHRRDLIPWFYIAAFLGWLHMLADRFSPKAIIHPIKARLRPPRPDPFIRS